MKKTTKFYVIMIIILGIGITIDLITKSLASNVNMPLISGIISIAFTWNKGAGWSLFSEHTLILTIFTGFLIVGIILLIMFFKPKSLVYTIGISMILAGAIGNFIDRVMFGAVRDFICLEFMTFPIFNVADVLLTVGVILLCVWLIFLSGKKENKNWQKIRFIKK